MEPNAYLVKFGAATQLAATGDYNTALSFLDTNSEQPLPPDAIHLKAKILAQQGHYKEAISLWQHALKQTPQRDDFKHAINKATQMLNKPLVRMIPKMKHIAALGIIIAVFMAALAWFFDTDVSQELIQLRQQIEQSQNNAIDPARQPQQNVQIENALEQLATLPEIDNQLNQLVTLLQNGNKLSASKVIPKENTAAITPPNLDINIKGITTRISGNKIILSFSEGLFYKWTNIRDKYNPALKQLATLLSKNPGLRITITGYTDGIPIRKNRSATDNITLAYSRAQTVANILRKESKLPSAVFTLAAADDALIPFSSKESKDRLKNLTATVTLETANTIRK